MEVYIEYVLLDNLVIDAIISVLTLKALRLSVNKYRIAVAVAFGTAAAFLLPLIHIHAAFLFFIRMAVGAAMAFLIYNHKSFKRYFICFLIFMLITFVFGGACLGVLFLIGADITNAATLNYQSGVPIGLIALTLAVTMFFLRQICLYLNKSKDISGYIRQAELFINGSSVKFDAFIDTGNQLYDSQSGLPVIIVESAILMRLLKNTLTNVLSFNAKDKPESVLKNGRYIEYSTLNGKNTRLLVFKPDKLVIYFKGQANIIYDVMAGVYNDKFDKAVKYSALLHPAIV
jgi:stage II sporulation protein GA (sporulation sigma-E factor processing peptidase)